MFDTPVDGWYTWLGVALAGVAVLGVTLGLPVAPPPTATDIATAVDATATSEYDAATTVDVDAEAIRLTPRGVAVRGRGGTARAAFQYGPVVRSLVANSTRFSTARSRPASSRRQRR